MVILLRRATSDSVETRLNFPQRSPFSESPIGTASCSFYWRYDWKPARGSAEARLYSDFLVARDWI